MSRPVLPPDVLESLQHGQKIEAIQRLRAATGLGLKEAKDMVDAHQHGAMGTGWSPVAMTDASLPAQVVQALKAGDKLEAIKLLRQHARIGLKEAKDRIDALGQPGDAGLAPGEVPRTAGRIGTWLTVAALAALALWWLFLRDPG